MKGDIRSQSIIIESISDSLIPCVSKLEYSKEIYEKLVELFLVSIVGKVLSLKQELYKFNLSREEGIISCFLKTSEIRYQL